MKLDDLDTVVALRNHRRNAIAVRDGVLRNPLEVRVQWTEYQPDGFISLRPVREFIASELAKFIAEKTAELTRLGVDVPVEQS